jgi:DNA repair protein RAD16
VQSILTNVRGTALRRATLKAFDSLPKTTKASGPSTIDDDSSDFPSLSGLGEYTAKKAARASLSSIETTNDYNESSDYSTPATSAFATPAPTKSAAKPSTARRGRRPATMTEEPTPASVSAIARAAALRNSQYALKPPTNTKRKRNVISDEEDADDSDSPDAQLARALQEQEDAAAAAAVGTMGSDNGLPLRRTPRKARKILPKSDYVSDSEDDSDMDFTAYSGPSSSKKLKIELGSKGANAVSFPSKRKSNMVLDSDDSDDFVEIDDSDDDEPVVSMSTPRSRMKQVIQKQSNDFKSKVRIIGERKLPILDGFLSKR